MSHTHSHFRPGEGAPLSVGRAFTIGILLNLAFVAVETAAGLWSGSMGLLSDAGHNLSDVAGLAIALGAYRLGKVSPSHRYTYGLRKSSVVASLLNAVILLVAVGAIVVESLRKLADPQPVGGAVIVWVAGAGVAVNLATALLFLRGRKDDLNVKGAFLHMAADALVSVGVMVSGAVVLWTGWYPVDAIVGLAVAAVILVSTWGLLRASVRLTLDGVPVGIDYGRVVEAIRSTEGVADVHHLHLWAISTTENALTAHLVVRAGYDALAVREAVRGRLCGAGIRHATLETEAVGYSCREAGGDCECNPKI